MRLIRLFFAIACLGLGAVVGALNRDLISIDLGVGSFSTNLGIALIVALLVGVLVGGMAVSASLVLPRRRRIAQAERPRAGSERPGAAG